LPKERPRAVDHSLAGEAHAGRRGPHDLVAR
jgi:hypothetical protein